MKISEVLNLDDGDIINEVSGTLTAVYDRKAGASEKGPWSFQDAMLEDESGSIKLKLCNRPELDRDNKGSSLTIRCHKGDKGKSGVYLLRETYNGKTTPKLKITPTGKFLFGGDGAVSQNGTSTTQEFKEHIKEVVSSNGNKPIFGGTAGCAVKLAVDVLLKACDGEGISYYKSEAFSQDAYQVASELVRVMQEIEKGNLYVAPPVDNVVEAAKEIFQAEEAE